MANDFVTFIVVRVDHIRDGEWLVSMNGRDVIAFSGPEAELRAQQCARELQLRLELSQELSNPCVH